MYLHAGGLQFSAYLVLVLVCTRLLMIISGRQKACQLKCGMIVQPTHDVRFADDGLRNSKISVPGLPTHLTSSLLKFLRLPAFEFKRPSQSLLLCLMAEERYPFCIMMVQTSLSE